MANELPPVATSGMRATGWELARRAERVEDRLLLTDTRDLLAHLPKGVRPTQLPRQYPRVLNQLRLYWEDTGLLTSYLDDLLSDRRGGRQGFPSLVQEELQALRAYVQQRADPAPPRSET